MNAIVNDSCISCGLCADTWVPPSSSDAPLLLCILKNILRSLLALSISMVLFRILNPVPVLQHNFSFSCQRYPKLHIRCL